MWVDDATFDPADQIERRSCPGDGSESALLELAVTLSTEPMPTNRPEWAAVVVSGLARDREARPAATGPSPAAVLGPIFRVLAGLGFYRRYLRGQHRFHTILTDLRGPDQVQMLGGSVVEPIIPVSLADLGNLSVTFVALSYAGVLTVSVIADPQQMPDIDVLAATLQRELDTSLDALTPSRPRMSRLDSVQVSG